MKKLIGGLFVAIMVATALWLGIKADTASIADVPPPETQANTTVLQTSTTDDDKLPPIEKSAMFIGIRKIKAKNGENKRFGVTVLDSEASRSVFLCPDPSSKISDIEAAKASVIMVDSDGDGRLEEIASYGGIVRRKGNEELFRQYDKHFQDYVRSVHVERFRAGKE